MSSQPQPALSPAPEMPPQAILMQMVFGKMVSFSIGAIAKLGIADHMSDEPRAVAEIAAAAGAHTDALQRVLRMLASVGLFTEAAGGKFGLTKVSRLLRADEPGSFRNMCIMQVDGWQAASWANLAHSIRTGEDAVAATFGKPVFELFHDIPESARTFQLAMTDFSRMSAAAVLEVADFARFHKIADVGGGHGTVLSRVLERYPQMQGVLFDLPEVSAGARTAGLFGNNVDRVTFEAGSFFERVPSGCDAYLMKHIVHDWDDESCRRIFRLMRAEMEKTAPEAGRLFLIEMIAPEGPEPSPAKMMDIEMLVATHGGRERTEAEFAALLESAGWKLAGVTPTKSPVCLIEARVG